MSRANYSKSSLAIAQTIQQIMAVGHLTRSEHLQLTSAILSDYKVSDEERHQISLIFDYLQAGRLSIVD